ncbi:ribosome maturation factor RimP [Tumebacillus sp. ITR2]|uniref:Ribosome maturation factor RimP n=1 Tax=Tumebacillus amylolyticus TaxID=2801339 RepID=A0ABS1JF81_9BACL|nr:ribosome maturation factor RimP [Tumebacillus amylolyticus]MBL0388952.1 ribosome maturation factor RimP [Tumebacillus amylolyticus]
MTKRKVTEIVEELAAPIVEGEGLELVDVEYKKEGANWFLRIFIDKPEGVDIDDCGRVSEKVSDMLDEVDPIPDSYFLEVSSPGAERPLKKPADFERSIGKQVYITTYEPVEGQKTFEGVLAGYDGDQVTVTEAKKTITLSAEKIASARLAVVF